MLYTSLDKVYINCNALLYWNSMYIHRLFMGEVLVSVLQLARIKCRLVLI